MPLNTYQCQSTGEWDAIELTPFSSAGIFSATANVYQFLVWYPIFTLVEIPLTVSRDFRYFGNKHYLGEIAYLNFGGVVETQYIQWQRHQGKLSLALPVPVFDRSVTAQNYSSFFNGLFPPIQRARSLSWDLHPGVEWTLEIAWQQGQQGYEIEGHSLAVI